MVIKHKKLVVVLVFLVITVIVAALGLKYFPFSKVIRMPASAEKEFTNPRKVSADAPNTLTFDFEIPAGKEVPGGFYKGIAHSGQYSVKAFGQNSFSPAVERTATEIGISNLNAVALSAWIYIFPTSKEVKGSLVFTASNELGMNVSWQGVSLHEPEVPKGKWFKISGYFDLSSVAFKPGYKVQVYFWNTSGTDILIDDYHIVFGNAPERRGDSALVDMTKPAGYVPKFNHPPYPFLFLEKAPVDPLIKPSGTGTDDFVVAGNFFGTNSDGILVIKRDGQMTGYTGCSENSKFAKMQITSPAPAISLIKQAIPGKFLGSDACQVVLVCDKKFMLCSFSSVKNPCPGAGEGSAILKVLSSSEAPSGTVYTGDFTGANRDGLLIVGKDGDWKLMVFEPGTEGQGHWKTTAQNATPPVKEWNRQNFTTGITAGSFIPGLTGTQLLTVSRAVEDHAYSYQIHRFNLSKQTWEPLFRNSFYGKTIGLDTLKPEDKFFVLRTGKPNTHRIFRYNRDWRFDLREIRFSDSAFAILSVADFQGYELNHNPKYYESLRLVPGKFSGGAASSFLVMGKNAPERQYGKILPDFIHIYSVPPEK